MYTLCKDLIPFWNPAPAVSRPCHHLQQLPCQDDDAGGAVPHLLVLGAAELDHALEMEVGREGMRRWYKVSPGA